MKFKTMTNSVNVQLVQIHQQKTVTTKKALI
jgi:hypothetical protein